MIFYFSSRVPKPFLVDLLLLLWLFLPLELPSSFFSPSCSFFLYLLLLTAIKTMKMMMTEMKIIAITAPALLSNFFLSPSSYSSYLSSMTTLTVTGSSSSKGKSSALDFNPSYRFFSYSSIIYSLWDEMSISTIEDPSLILLITMSLVFTFYFFVMTLRTDSLRELL